MALQMVVNRRLYVQIAEQIRGLIRSGEYERGRQLPSERELAQQLGVSRPTVREAIIALEIAGLLEVRVGVGVFVTPEPRGTANLPVADQSPLEVMQARALIEPEIAALAAESITEAGIEQLEASLALLHDRATEGRWSEVGDRLLHQTLAEHCGNQVLRNIGIALWHDREEQLSARFHRHVATIPGLLTAIDRHHAAITEAVKARDPAGAREAMRHHLEEVLRRTEAIVG